MPTIIDGAVPAAAVAGAAVVDDGPKKKPAEGGGGSGGGPPEERARKAVATAAAVGQMSAASGSELLGRSASKPADTGVSVVVASSKGPRAEVTVVTAAAPTAAASASGVAAAASGKINPAPGGGVRPALCFVCRRKFADLRALRRHEEKSELHQTNLHKLEERRRKQREQTQAQRRKPPHEAQVQEQRREEGAEAPPPPSVRAAQAVDVVSSSAAAAAIAPEQHGSPPPAAGQSSGEISAPATPLVIPSAVEPAVPAAVVSSTTSPSVAMVLPPVPGQPLVSTAIEVEAKAEIAPKPSPPPPLPAVSTATASAVATFSESVKKLPASSPSGIGVGAEAGPLAATSVVSLPAKEKRWDSRLGRGTHRDAADGEDDDGEGSGEGEDEARSEREDHRSFHPRRASKRRRRGEEMSSGPIRAWKCGTCLSRYFDTYDEAFDHETRCDGEGNEVSEKRVIGVGAGGGDSRIGSEIGEADRVASGVDDSGGGGEGEGAAWTKSTSDSALVVPMDADANGRRPSDRLYEDARLVLSPLELFEVTESWARDECVSGRKRKNRKKATVRPPGFVGVRCRACASLPLWGRPAASVMFPRDVSGVAPTVYKLAARHFPVCPSLPQDYMRKVAAWRARRPIRRGVDAETGQVAAQRYVTDMTRVWGLMDVLKWGESGVAFRESRLLDWSKLDAKGGEGATAWFARKDEDEEDGDEEEEEVAAPRDDGSDEEEHGRDVQKSWIRDQRPLPAEQEERESRERGQQPRWKRHALDRRRRKKRKKEKLARTEEEADYADLDTDEIAGTGTAGGGTNPSSSDDLVFHDPSSENFVIGAGPEGTDGYEFSLLVPGEDEQNLPAVHCFVRSRCVEAFVVTQTDVDRGGLLRGHHKNLTMDVGQVGLRCVFCGSGSRNAAVGERKGGKTGEVENDETFGKAGGPGRKDAAGSYAYSSVYPTTTRRIFDAVARIASRHLDMCELAPLSVKAMFRKLRGKDQDARTRGYLPAEYCHRAAERMGIVNTRSGLRLDRAKHERWLEDLEDLERRGKEEGEEGEREEEEQGLPGVERLAALPAILGVPSEEKYMTPLHAHARASVQLFVVKTQADVDAYSIAANIRVRPGMVGLRCVYCQRAYPASEGVKCRFPTSVNDIYEQVRFFTYQHFFSGGCRNMPAEASAKFTAARHNKSKNLNIRWLYRSTARAMGLYNFPHRGIGFRKTEQHVRDSGTPPQDRAEGTDSLIDNTEKPHEGSESSSYESSQLYDEEDGSNSKYQIVSSFIRPSERDMITPFKRRFYSYLRVTRFALGRHDCNGHRRNVPNGTLGTGCVYCTHRSFFASTCNIWLQSTLPKLQHHILSDCPAIGDEERAKLEKMKARCKATPRLNKEMHRRLWRRLQSFDDSAQTSDRGDGPRSDGSESDSHSNDTRSSDTHGSDSSSDLEEDGETVTEESSGDESLRNEIDSSHETSPNAEGSASVRDFAPISLQPSGETGAVPLIKPSPPNTLAALVRPAEREIDTKFKLRLFEHVGICNLPGGTAHKGRRKMVPLGCPGIVCVHCNEKTFFSTKDVHIFGHNMRQMYKHLTECKRVPKDQLLELSKLKTIHSALPLEDRGEFYRRLWQRMLQFSIDRGIIDEKVAAAFA